MSEVFSASSSEEMVLAAREAAAAGRLLRATDELLPLSFGPLGVDGLPVNEAENVPV